MTTLIHPINHASALWSETKCREHAASWLCKVNRHDRKTEAQRYQDQWNSAHTIAISSVHKKHSRRMAKAYADFIDGHWIIFE